MSDKPMTVTARIFTFEKNDKGEDGAWSNDRTDWYPKQVILNVVKRNQQSQRRVALEVKEDGVWATLKKEEP